jgi:hypothetical protein
MNGKENSNVARQHTWGANMIIRVDLVILEILYEYANV